MDNKKFFDTSFLYGANSGFIEDLYVEYLESPGAVSEEWKSFFEGLDESSLEALKSTIAPGWKNRRNKIINVEIVEEESQPSRASSKAEVLNAESLVEAFRNRGHLLAEIDPLGLEVLPTEEDLRISPSEFGFSSSSQKVVLSKPYKGEKEWVLSGLHKDLKKTYCANIGFEIDQVEDFEQRDWLTDRIESFDFDKEISKEKRLEALHTLAEVCGFEQFLQSRFPGAKRFSVEGGDASIVCARNIIKTSASLGVTEMVFGMPHRGRLNMLAKVFNKPYKALLAEFQGALSHPDTLDVSGDVKYHLGQSTDFELKTGEKVHISLTPNPSHLEAVNPVVAGKVRAKQDASGDVERLKAMGVLFHGDASFSGQGVVFETLMLGDLESYKTGGTVHVVVNNQIGFTATPSKGRGKSRYCTDVAKTIKAPIFHVNGNCPDDVMKVSQIAAEFRHKFGKDVVVDVVCYRLHGHNEMDEPRFTQPEMYKFIDQEKTPFSIYAQTLVSQGLVVEEEIKSIKDSFRKLLDEQLNESKSYKSEKADWLEGKWEGYQSEINVDKNNLTGVPVDKLRKIGIKAATIPQEVNAHKTIQRGYAARLKAIESGENVDWGCAEMLAFASLLDEGHKVRLTGQDSRRGTFSHRQSVVVDQQNYKEYYPLNHISETQAFYEVDDSSLSEFAVMGFEYGYSTASPQTLTIWEGQFGDFANTAQVIIDQFISSAETKWLRLSGLVLLLPHGYEGQGPEHSSARLERYLQLCAEDNMQVVNLTTPANYFHALRRQILSNYRKPLIVMSPKSLLRHKLAVSKIDSFSGQTHFHHIIEDSPHYVEKATSLVLCSGKIFYDLFESREANESKKVSLLRVEQLYPFPEEQLLRSIKKHKNLKKIIWCQEEPRNMGSWYFIRPKLEKLITKTQYKSKINVEFVGRSASASPAAGYASKHKAQQEKIVEKALS
ncbi:MAG: 2-oxoglutarate dehydrogenase E1 component [Rickettsiales bacterium]